MTVTPEAGGALTKAPGALLAVLAEEPHLGMPDLTKYLAASRNTINVWLQIFEEVAQIEVPTGARHARLVNVYLMTVISEAMRAFKQGGITKQEALREQLRLTGFTPPEPVDEVALLRQANAVLQQQADDAKVHLRQAEETIQTYSRLLDEARQQLNDLHLAHDSEPEDHAGPAVLTVNPSPSSTPLPVTPTTSRGDQAAIFLRRLIRSLP